MRGRATGLSLFELLIIVAVATAVGVAGLPALGRAVASARIGAEINELHHALHLARRESILRNRYVVLCPTADRLRCGDDWAAGWMLFFDTDRYRPPQSYYGEPLLRVGGTGNRVARMANRQAFVARTRRWRSTNGTFVICDPAGRAAPKALVVSYTGRPRTRAAVPAECLPPRD
ncbi:MAG: GspH/FimT family protein [Pseudomonadota bacterium]